MKKCSTAALCLALAISSAPWAHASCEFLQQAPDAHVVVQGDTLWDIAARFLNNPWCWPQVWEPNREHIHDPHWIYPGQTIVFDRAHGKLLVKTAEISVAASDITKLTPRARAESLRPEALPTIAPHLLSFLRHTPLISITALKQAPKIIRFDEGRGMSGTGDVAFVEGELQGQRQFELLRPFREIKDPASGKLLALSSLRLGRALWQASEGARLHRFRIQSSDSEILPGDLLLPATTDSGLQAIPHAANSMTGQVAALMREGRWVGLHDVVALNRGTAEGMDAGSVVRVERQVKMADLKPSTGRLPTIMSQEVATLFVFEVLEQTSLALVMRAEHEFTIGDVFHSTTASPGSAANTMASSRP